MKKMLFEAAAWASAGISFNLVNAAGKLWERGNAIASIVGWVLAAACYFGFVWAIDGYAKVKAEVAG